MRWWFCHFPGSNAESMCFRTYLRTLPPCREGGKNFLKREDFARAEQVRAKGNADGKEVAALGFWKIACCHSCRFFSQVGCQ